MSTENLIIDGSFAEELVHWRTSSPEYVTIVHNPPGDNYAKIAVGNATGLTQVVPRAAGDYTLTFRSCYVGPNCSVRVWGQNQSGGWEFIIFPNMPVNYNQNIWNTNTFNFNVADKYTEFKVEFYASYQTTFMFTNVSVTKQ